MSVNVGQRNVVDNPANRMFYAVDKARELSIHTIKICTNQNIFIPQYQMITQEIINISMDIYKDAWTANNVKVDGDPEKWRYRKALEERSAIGCNNLLAMIGLSKQLFHLKSAKEKYWSELTLETRNLIRKWKESDQNRYGT